MCAVQSKDPADWYLAEQNGGASSLEATLGSAAYFISRSSFWLILIHLVPFPVAAILAFWWYRFRKVIPVCQQLTVERVDGPNNYVKGKPLPRNVLVACLEHIIIIPEKGVQVKVVAGGLGKVHGLMAHYHPGNFISVHPCMTDKDYSFCEPVEPVFVVVRSENTEQELEVQVLKCVLNPAPDTDEPTVTFYMLDHPIFRDRHSGIYPSPQTARQTLIFYSVWNQALAKVIDRTKPDMYHCADFHSAMAVMYLEMALPVFVILHNAEYQGNINNMQMRRKEIHFFADIFNLTVHEVKSDCMTDGGFNMLKPIVKFALENQKGYGFCTVSRTYALEAMQKHQVLWPLPKLRGLENCMPENERPKIDPDTPFKEQRALAKLSIQKKFGLEQRLDAKVFVFLGRWVKQKGMDYIADVTEWMLTKYETAQLLVIGPVGDAFGSYAAEKFNSLTKTHKFDGRLFVYAGFLIVPKELKLACDFCLMPSRDEPFGYVDIEFGWFGAATVGAFKGGLGKVPGFYYQAQNADSDKHVQQCLRRAIAQAIESPQEVLDEMTQNALASSFPVLDWQDEMKDIYSEVLANYGKKRGMGGKKGVRAAIRKFCRTIKKKLRKKKKANRRKTRARRQSIDLHHGDGMIDFPSEIADPMAGSDDESIPDEQKAQKPMSMRRVVFDDQLDREESMIIVDCDKLSQGSGDGRHGTASHGILKSPSKARSSIRGLRPSRRYSTISGASQHSASSECPAFPPTATMIAKLPTNERHQVAKLAPHSARMVHFGDGGGDGTPSAHIASGGCEDCVFCRAFRAEMNGDGEVETGGGFGHLWTSEASAAPSFMGAGSPTGAGARRPSGLELPPGHAVRDRSGSVTSCEGCPYCIAARAEMYGEAYCLPTGHLWTSEASGLPGPGTLQIPRAHFSHHGGRGRDTSHTSFQSFQSGTTGPESPTSHSRAYSKATIESDADSLGFPAMAYADVHGGGATRPSFDLQSDLGFRTHRGSNARQQSLQSLMGGRPEFDADASFELGFLPQDIARIQSGLGFGEEQQGVAIGELELEAYGAYSSAQPQQAPRRRQLSMAEAAVLKSYGYESQGTYDSHRDSGGGGVTRRSTGMDIQGVQSLNSEGLRDQVGSWMLGSQDGSLDGLGAEGMYGLDPGDLSGQEPRFSGRFDFPDLRRDLTQISELVDDESDHSGFMSGDEKEEMEVLEQECTEEVLQFLVEGKMAKAGSKYPAAPAVLEAVQWDLDLAKERHKVTWLLAIPMFDAIFIDWIIAWAYATGPIMTSLFLSQCCVTAFPIIEPLVQTVAVLVWTWAARHIRKPNRLLVVVLFSRLTCILPAIFGAPAWTGGVLLGISTAGDSLFIYFNFMGKQRGDISRLGGRTGFLVVLRKTCEWLYFAFTELKGDNLFTARVVAVIFFVLIPGVCVWFAPQAYKRFTLPTAQKQFMMGLRWDGRCRVLLYLGLANVVKNLYFIAERPGFLEWRMREKYPPEAVWIYGVYIGLSSALVITLFANLFDRFADYTMTWLKAFAFFSLCPAFIRIWGMRYLKPNTSIEAVYSDIVSLASLTLESVQLLATTMAFVATVGSRWRLTVFTCVTTAASGLARAFSTWIYMWSTGDSEPLRVEKEPDTIARECFMIALVPCILECIFRIMGIFYFDMEATAMLWTRRQQKIALFLDFDLKRMRRAIKQTLLNDGEDRLATKEEEIERRRKQIETQREELEKQQEKIQELVSQTKKLEEQMTQKAPAPPLVQVAVPKPPTEGPSPMVPPPAG